MADGKGVMSVVDQRPATLLIDGAWQAGEAAFDVVDPATLEVIGRAADGGADQARRALDASVRAFPGWRATPAEERSGHLRAAAAEIRAQAARLAALLTEENGKPLAEARGEILGAARMLEWGAEEGRRAYGRVTPPSANGPGLVVREPVGPTLAITPWNFPASMVVRKVGLALAAGAPVTLKPAEQTPLIATELVRLINATGLPAGVLQSITTSRPGEVAQAMLADRRLRKVSFTGSTEVGLSLLRDTRSHLRRTSLEMGGHAPAIVFADADLDAAVSGVITAKFTNAGQSCTAINRLYVQEDIHDEFVRMLTERVAALRLGHGAREGTTIGPLIDAAGLEKVTRHVQDAVARGAHVVIGGQVWQPDEESLRGAFYEPTILTDVTEKMLVNVEETFGPVLPVQRFDTDEEAIEAANDTDYGLAAYLFAAELKRVWSAAERLAFGVVGVNEPTPVRPELPFGGVKNSGQEREGGVEGIDAYLETKAISMRL
jgi:succinate-semialdehyde dehydrogenase/glutarate-semialdehyde dehydrogenase